MNERLEDILGGVEEEIRLAEERLRLNSFGISRSAGGCCLPHCTVLST